MEITTIIKAIIALCGSVITVFAVPWLKRKLGAQGIENLRVWVQIAVAAAEQIYEAADGAEKKLYVERFLTEKGYKLTSSEIDSAIEAEVLRLHNELYGTKREALE